MSVCEAYERKVYQDQVLPVSALFWALCNLCELRARILAR